MEKQKTRRERDGEDADGPKRKVRVVEERDGAEVEAPPSEAEVEEFFAIVRRMHAAVKYFCQKANGADGKLPGKWRAALEAEEGAAADAGEVLDDKERVKKEAAATTTTPTPTPTPEGVAVENGVLDLNSAPEEGCAD